MIRTQIWEFQTCECIVEEQYDDSIEYNATLKQIIKKCSEHAILDGNLLYQTAKKETTTKNDIDRFIKSNLPEFTELDENKQIQYRKGLKYSWIFVGTGINRELRVKMKGVTLSAQQKEMLQTFSNTISNKVKVT